MESYEMLSPEKKVFNDFISHLRNGSSFLLEPNSRPAYKRDYFSGQPMTGINMLQVNQGLKDNGKNSNCVFDYNIARMKGKAFSAETAEGYTVAPGAKAVSIVQNTDRDNRKTFSFYFASQDLETFTRDGTYADGTPIMTRYKAPLASYSNEALGDPSHLPYKRRNDSGREILKEKLTEAFKGKYQGNYKGMKILDWEINAIEKEFKDKPKEFTKIAEASSVYALGNEIEIKKMKQDLYATGFDKVLGVASPSAEETDRMALEKARNASAYDFTNSLSDTEAYDRAVRSARHR